jgi:predicted Zn-dependent protease
MIAVPLVLVACAAPGTVIDRGAGHGNGVTSASPRLQTHFWRLSELIESKQPAILLQEPAGVHGPVETKLLRRIAATGEKVIQAGGGELQADLVILASPRINAYAFYPGEQPTIGFTLGMVRLLAADQDAWAALLGHELAHLRLDHIEGMRDRRKQADVTSSLAGLVLSAIGLPFASVAADAATVLADRAYSRDDEREADRFGLAYMRKAGFADEGAITLQQLLLGAGTSVSLPFLGTHPSGEERIAALRELMRIAP